MEYKENTAKYIDVIRKELMRYVTVISKSDLHKSAGENLINIIYDKKIPPLHNITHSNEALFVANTLFEPLSEIMSTIEIIELIPLFIKTFPYSRKGMSKSRYIQYHVGNYFVEVGNLNYRLKLYLNKLKNAYRKTAKKKEHIDQITKILQKYRETVLKGPIGVRDNHIHNFRYSDKELDRLATIELLNGEGKSREELLLGLQYEAAFKKARHKWIKQIKENSSQIEQIIDFYFKALMKIVAPKGSIVYPFDNEKI